jgi:RNA polymerase-binding transcription factor DksA
MSSFINHFKKTAEQNAKDLQDNEHGVVGQWQDYPTNWEEMQTADIDEMEQVKLEQIKQDNREPIEEESEERQYCISRADTL